MTLFDYLVLGVVGFSMFLGIMRGMVKEVFSLVNWMIAFWVANRYGSELTLNFEWAKELSSGLQSALGYGIAFVASMIVGSILVGLIGRIITASGLKFADRFLGAMFGVVRGSLIVGLVVVGAGFTTLPAKDFWQKAKLAPLVENGIRSVKPHLPEKVASWVRY